MFHRMHLGYLLAAAVALAGCTRAPEALTPEAAHAKGDALLREMSAAAGALQTIAYTATEVREEVVNGVKSETRSVRRVVMRRPNALTFTATGDKRDGAFWYDGEFVYASDFGEESGQGASLVPLRHVTVGPPRTLLWSFAVYL